MWLRPADWYHPAVDALVEAVLGSTDACGAAARLGEVRGQNGVGIAETIDDFGCLFRAALLGDPPLDAVRALCEGWSGAMDAAPVFSLCVDPESGLATAEYLAMRLAEVYGVAHRRRERATASHALVIVDVATEQVAPWRRMARSAAIGKALTTAHGTGHPMAALGGGVFAVLITRDANLTDELRTLRDAVMAQAAALQIGDIMRQPPRVWVEPLPETHDAAIELLTHLRR